MFYIWYLFNLLQNENQYIMISRVNSDHLISISSNFDFGYQIRIKATNLILVLKLSKLITHYYLFY